MEFKFKKKIVNVNNLRVNHKGLYFLKENKIIRNNSILFEIEKGEVNFDVKDKFVYIINDNKTIEISEKEGFIREINCAIILESIFERKAIFTYDRNIRKRIFHRGYYEFNEALVKKNDITNYNGLGKSFFVETMFFYIQRRSNLLKALSYENKILWNLDITELLDIERFIGINNNELIILLSDCMVLVIDVNTGKIIKIVDLNEKKPLKNFIIENIHLDNEKNILKCLAGRYYFELNLKNFKIEVKHDFGEYKEGNWWISRSKMFGKYLTFVGSKEGVNTFANSFGVYDTEKLEVIWYDGIKPDEREKKGFYVNPPLINEKKLAVVDTNKVLHVYDKVNMYS